MDLTREELEKGVRCACCGQFAKIYTRKINSSMVRSLIKFVKYYDHRLASEWVHAANILPPPVGSDFPKLRFWGLIESKCDYKLDGNSAGMWRVLPKGYAFAAGKVTVPEKIKIYDNVLYGHSENETTIQKALGRHFNYNELMNMSDDYI